MSEIRLNIDGREVTGFEGRTILETAKKYGIEIPTLCHDERAEMYGSCGICVVEAEGNPRLLRSCSTLAADGMVIRTDTERIRRSRTSGLELLLSDHTGDCRAPCTLACPAQTDCQGYAGLIANGEYGEALKLIKDKIPLPASIGRVCPHPCEQACRRRLVEEPVSIAVLKRFIGDLGLEYTPVTKEPTGKSAAVIGGGPGGLTAAYFLRAQGHEVTVYEAMPKMGGMLQYGVPEYRLPKEVLQREITGIEKMGVKFRNNTKVGRDITLEYLRNSHNAVIVAVGAWKSTPLGCKGEELEGVLSAVDFLSGAALKPNGAVLSGRRVAVVGGGNVAMDACRTAVRLGAERVYNIYRRTRNEMPADEIEITGAEEEGVIFKNLANPIEIIGTDKVTAVRLQIMELGAPDASGRRSPVPAGGKEGKEGKEGKKGKEGKEGKENEEIIEADAVIIAISRKTDAAGLEELEMSGRGTIAADAQTFRTNLDGVFAIGDATNNGADIAAAAIGEGRRAAEMADKYLNGEVLEYRPRYLVKAEKTAEDFVGKAKAERVKIPRRTPEARRGDFLEVNPGLGGEAAKKEAHRCLECGCRDYFGCKLIDYANRYDVQPEKYEGEMHKRAVKECEHPFIHRNPDKCILCGLCVRVCEKGGAAALGLVNRGFDTVVKPAFDADLRDTDCISCGQCADVCPTGALTETLMIGKQVPLREKFTETVCSFCSAGCKTKLASAGGLLTRSLPVSERAGDNLLCMDGRFGFGEIAKKDRLTMPLIRGAEPGAELREASFDEAISRANKSLRDLRSRYGDCVAVTVSDRYTNEEIYAVKEYAGKALKTGRVYSFSRAGSGLADVLGRDASTADFDGLEHADLIVVVAPEICGAAGTAGVAGVPGVHGVPGVPGMKINRAVDRGAKLLKIDDLAVLRQTADVLSARDSAAGVDAGKEAEAEARAAAGMLRQAGKAVFIFEKNVITRQAARLVASIAVLSGHDGKKPGGGIIQLLSGANAQGLSDAGVLSGEELTRAIDGGEIKGLFIFGEDTSADLSALEFLAVQDLYITDTANRADIIFPAASFAEISGSFTGTDGKRRELRPAVKCPAALDNLALITALAAGADISAAGIPEPDKPRAAKPPVDRIAEGDTLRRAADTADTVENTNGIAVSFKKFAAANRL